MNDDFAFERLVGQSGWTARTLRRILQAAAYSYPVLIQGPAGTGKRLVARAIHQHSLRGPRSFVPVRCALLRGPLGIAQIFGQEAGAFSFLPAATLGSLQVAEGGTLLLEEVGLLDADAQARLLEFLTTKRARPIGGEPRSELNVRIIATSSRDLRELVTEKQFSFELLYRLNALYVEALPLRERREDIGPLVRHAIARVTLERGLGLRRLTPAAMATLEMGSWPGNVAQLLRVVEQAVLAVPHREVLDVDDIAEWLPVEDEVRASDSVPGDRPVNAYESLPAWEVVERPWPTLAEITERHVRATLERAGNRLDVAARMLRIGREQLLQRMTECGLALPLADDRRLGDAIPSTPGDQPPGASPADDGSSNGLRSAG
jgi:DNA-binding NtrC family response regulator